MNGASSTHGSDEKFLQNFGRKTWITSVRRSGLFSYGSGQGPVAGSCEHGNGP